MAFASRDIVGEYLLNPGCSGRGGLGFLPGALRSSLRDREWRLSRAWRAQGLSVNKGGLLHLSKEVVTHTPWDVTGALRGEV